VMGDRRMQISKLLLAAALASIASGPAIAADCYQLTLQFATIGLSIDRVSHGGDRDTTFFKSPLLASSRIT
jgi:opacity protein-like surface antigen